MNPSDLLQMQRLVDGECDEAELRSLLLDAENQPDGWRQIATAFVEDKFWQTQFRQTGTRNDSQAILTRSGTRCLGTNGKPPKSFGSNSVDHFIRE